MKYLISHFALLVILNNTIAQASTLEIHPDTILGKAEKVKSSNPQMAIQSINNLLESSNNLDVQYRFRAYKSLSDIYIYQGLFDLARSMAGNMQRLVNENDQLAPRYQITVYNQLAEVNKEKYLFDTLTYRDTLDVALQDYKKAYNIFSDKKELIKQQYKQENLTGKEILLEAMLLQNLGETYIYKNQLKIAEENLKRAETLSRLSFSDTLLQAGMDRIKGYLFLNMYFLYSRKTPERVNHLAKDYLNKCIEIRKSQKKEFVYEYAVGLYFQAEEEYLANLGKKNGNEEALSMLDDAIQFAKNASLSILSYKCSVLQNKMLKEQKETIAYQKDILTYMLLALGVVVVLAIYFAFLIYRINRNDKKRLVDQEALSKIAQGMLASLDVKTIIENLHSQIKLLFPTTDVFGISIYDTKSDKLVTQYAKYQDEEYHGVYTRDVADKEQLPVICFDSQEPIIMGNATQETLERYKFRFEDGGKTLESGKVTQAVSSLIYVPLPERGGTMTIQSLLTNAYNKRDKELLAAIASIAGLALANAQKYDTLSGWSSTLDKVLTQLRHSLLHIERKKVLFEELRNMSHNETETANLKELESAFLDYVFTLNILDNWLNKIIVVPGRYPSFPEKIFLFNWFNMGFMETRSMADNKKVNLINDFDPNHFIYTDKGPLSLILHNLITNSIKNTSQNGSITLSSRETEEYDVEITVKDNGMGMSADVLNILQKGLLYPEVNDSSVFQTLPNRNDGKGMGLLTCKNMIAQNGYFLSIHSTLGEGTTIVFLLKNKMKHYEP